jgi:hypothetical protein
MIKALQILPGIGFFERTLSITPLHFFYARDFAAVRHLENFRLNCSKLALELAMHSPANQIIFGDLQLFSYHS